MAINIGDVLVTLAAKDGITPTLTNIGKQFTVFGAAITGALGVAVKRFADAGDEIQKLAQRTGFSTETLSEYKHALELSDATLQDLEVSSARLAVSLRSAQDEMTRGKGEGGEYSRALEELGFHYQDLINLSPEQQFEKVALAIADIDNKTTQVDLVRSLFGRGGTALLPLLADGAEGLRSMREEARELGLVFDEETANAAAEFNDNLSRLQASLAGAFREAAAALLPTLNDLAVQLKELILSVKEFATANPALFATIVKLVGAFGVFMTVAGPILLILPGIASAITSVAAAAPLAGAAIAALTGPIGLTVAAVVGLVAVIQQVIDKWQMLQQLPGAIGDFIGLDGEVGFDSSNRAVIETDQEKLNRQAAAALARQEGQGGGGTTNVTVSHGTFMPGQRNDVDAALAASAA